MNTKSLRLLAAALMAGPMAVQAVPISVATTGNFFSYSSLWGTTDNFAPIVIDQVNKTIDGIGSIAAALTFDPGSIRSNVGASFTTNFESALTFEQAGSTSISLRASAPSSANFNTSYGLNFDMSGSLVGFGSINPIHINIFGIETYASTALVDSTFSGIGNRDVFGFGYGLPVGFGANVTAFLRQTSTLDLGYMGGTVIARLKGTTGYISERSADFTLGNPGARNAGFTLGDLDSVLLNLQQAGDWDLFVSNVGIKNSYFTTNFDVGFSAVLDTPVSSPFRYDLPFTIPFASLGTKPLTYTGSASRYLGRISVAEQYVPPPGPPGSVPEPGTLALLGLGLAGLGLSRRKAN